MSNIIQKAVSNNGLVKKEEEKLVTLLSKHFDQIQAGLPREFSPERFRRLLVSAYNADLALQKCDLMSFISAGLTSIQLGLEPNTPLGEAWLIPYGNKVQFQLGWKGIKTLVYRSPRISFIDGGVVHQNDSYEFIKGSKPSVRHEIHIGNRGDVIGYYALFNTKDGYTGFDVMSHEDMLKHKEKYVKLNSKAWNESFDSMALKTVFKRALRFAPIDVEISNIYKSDGAVRSVITNNLIDEPMEDLNDVIDTEAEPIDG